MASSEQYLKRVTKASEDKVQMLAPTVRGTATRTLPQLPIEVWENVIDHLWDDQRALTGCIFVCRAWYPPSCLHLRRHIGISSVNGVKAYAKVLKQTPELSRSKRLHNMSISGDWGAIFGNLNQQSDLSALSLAAIMLARKLPPVETLTIQDSEWMPWTMHRDVFLHLSGFSVTCLSLYGVTFPSITVFGRLVCALRALVKLKCRHLIFTHNYFHRDTFGPYRDRVNIASLELGGYLIRAGKLIDFLAYPGILSHLQKLTLRDIDTYTPPYKLDWQPLFDAASGSLSELRCELQLSALQTDTKMSTTALLPSFTDHTPLQRLWAKFTGHFQDSDLDRLCQIFLSIKSGQLREIVIVFFWPTLLYGTSKEVKKDVKGFLKLHESARHKETDNHFSSDSFGLLSRIEFVLIYRDWSGGRVDRTILSEEQWKQQFESLFPKLTKRGIFRATMRDDAYENEF